MRTVWHGWSSYIFETQTGTCSISIWRRRRAWVMRRKWKNEILWILVFPTLHQNFDRFEITRSSFCHSGFLIENRQRNPSSHALQISESKHVSFCNLKVCPLLHIYLSTFSWRSFSVVKINLICKHLMFLQITWKSQWTNGEVICCDLSVSISA